MGPRILVVDDEPFLRRILTHILVKAGYQVECAEDGDDAWSRLSRPAQPDLVISDLMMPGLSGADLVRRLRTDRKSSIPFLILTACGHGMDTQKARDCGADALMAKPFCQRELLEQVTALLGRDRSGRHDR
jgi:DNA-binding response OmpR family regulator